MKPLSETARIFRLRHAAEKRADALERRLLSARIAARERFAARERDADRKRLSEQGRLTEARNRVTRCQHLRSAVHASGLKLVAIARAAGMTDTTLSGHLMGVRPVTEQRLAAVRAAIAELNGS